MTVLVLYTRYSKYDRATFSDSLYCFQRYVPGVEFIYQDVQKPTDIDKSLLSVPFSAVIMHYTFLAKRQNRLQWPVFFEEIVPRVRALNGVKILLPQDEYYFTGALRDMVRAFEADYVFTNARGSNIDKLYPRDIIGSKAQFQFVFTGYVDENSLIRMREIDRLVERRNIDIGYRGMQLPYCFGHHGQLKYEITRRFSEALKRYPRINADIETTGVRDLDVLVGDDWTEFLLRSRVTLGCLGGSSLIVEDDVIFNAINQYCCTHPGALFCEVEQEVFPGQDGLISMALLSPKLFECAAAKSCLALVEGDYYGVFEPGVHFIEIKNDFSNIDDAILRTQDPVYCRMMAQRCFDDIVAPSVDDNPYTYAHFARKIMACVPPAVAVTGAGVAGLERLAKTQRKREQRQRTKEKWHMFRIKWVGPLRVRKMERTRRKMEYYGPFGLVGLMKSAMWRLLERHPSLVKLLKKVLFYEQWHKKTPAEHN